MSTAFAPGDEYNIALARIYILVFENEELVYTVLLQGSDLDDSANGPNQAAIKDDVLFAADLRSEDSGQRDWRTATM
jgi:hypothetical protein